MAALSQNPLADIVSRNRKGQQAGIYSVCSANPFVLEASKLEAKANDTVLLIEATCNQVNQYGGYTGMTPVDFINYTYAIADKVDFPRQQLILGGDHLGPNPWKKLTADKAMAKAEDLVKAYVESGYTKIHLDASMSCADDPSPLPPTTIAKRAALMCKAAESVKPESATVYYIIGTEVPVPGGGRATRQLEKLLSWLRSRTKICPSIQF